MSAASGCAERAAAAAVERQPLLSNTGAERTEIGWGWLAGTVHGPIAQVLGHFGRLFGSVEECGYGSKWYGKSADVGALGVRLAWAARGAGAESSGRADEVSFVIPQKACDSLGWLACANVAYGLRALKVHWSRADCYWDDRARTVLPNVVLEAFNGGDRVSRVKSSRVMRKFRSGEVVGETSYLGSPQADRQVRVYDKDMEQGAEIGTYGIRWEEQGRGGAAAELIDQVLLEMEFDRIGERFAAQLTRHVDFVDRASGQAHGERCERLAWWVAIVGQVERARGIAVQVISSLESLERWVDRQVSPTLALLLLAAGGDVDVLARYARRGLARLRSSQLELLPVELRPQLA